MLTSMNIERLLLACMILVAGSLVAMNGLAATKIFKTVDADGNVVFSDLPAGSNQNPETVEVEAPNIFDSEGAAAQGAEPWVAVGDDAGAGPALPQAYSSLTIATPAADESIRDNTGNLNVVAHLVPALQSGHSVRLLLDNVPAGLASSAGEDATFALSNIDRGTHTLTAEVVDGNGAEHLTFSGARTILVRKNQDDSACSHRHWDLPGK